MERIEYLYVPPFFHSHTLTHTHEHTHEHTCELEQPLISFPSSFSSTSPSPAPSQNKNKSQVHQLGHWGCGVFARAVHTA